MAVATSVVAIGILSGCTPAPDNSYEGMPEPTETPYVYFNTETGKITKITDEEGETTYEDGASDQDDRTAHGGSDPYASYTLERLVELEGKPYPIEVSIGLSMNAPERDELIVFYNEHIAAPEQDTTAPPDPYFSLWGEVLGFVQAQIRHGEETGQLSGLQIQQTGETSRKADTRIADAWRSGMPAWQAAESFGDNTDSNHSPQNPYPPSQNGPVEPEYSYSFYCANYGVELAGKDEALAWLNSLTGTQFMSLSINSSPNEVSAETPEPCSMSTKYPEPEYPSSGGSYNAPPAPPGGW